MFERHELSVGSPSPSSCQTQPDAIAHDPARARAWRRHALQSCLYLASSLAAFVYLWLSLTLYPTNFLIMAVRSFARRLFTPSAAS